MKEPHFCFAGHTDVVPAGDESVWTYPPFAGQQANGAIYGRGVSDMKGAIACFISAISKLQMSKDITDVGSVSLLITGDEEGPCINGTEKVLKWVRDNGHVPSHCVVGEPTNPTKIGEMIKIGRRGSVNGKVVINGRKGHVAYAKLANNPIRGLCAVVEVLNRLRLDNGTAFFEPSNLEFTSLDVDNRAVNVIPDSAQGSFNIRYNDAHTREGLEVLMRNTIASTLDGTGLEYDLRFDRGSEPFFSNPGPEIKRFEAAIQLSTGLTPVRSTSGGTSDARFIKAYCPVFEFGLVNETIHKVDEHAKLSDINMLTTVYGEFVKSYFRK
jgi:succinyl-diaminopimelate desuccinylase